MEYSLIKWYQKGNILCGMNQLWVGNVTLWYQSHKFNIDPARAICQHIKSKFQKLNLRGCLPHVLKIIHMELGKIHEEFEGMEPRG
jgi:hypothetical protein